MDIKKSFGEDKSLAHDGKWFDLENGGRVRVAKLGCPAFKAEVQRLQKPHTALLRSSLDNSKLVDEITNQAMAKTILLDWSDIELDGEALPYSVETALQLITNFPDFKEIISVLSSERKNFMPEDIAGK